MTVNMPSRGDPRTEITDLAIVGGGMAGLYLARRERESGYRGKIVICEAHQSVGGRLRSSLLDLGDDKIVVEKGGMRFTRQHALLNQLIDSVPFDGRMLAEDVIQFPMSGDDNIFFLRGHRFKAKELADSNYHVLSQAYSLEESERGKSPVELLGHAISMVARENRQPSGWFPVSPEDWTRFRQHSFRGIPVRDYTLSLLLARAGLSNEAVQMTVDMLGFSAPRDLRANAGAALQLLANFSPESTYQTLRTGYQSLAHGLLDLLRTSEVQVREGYRLVDLEASGGGYRLEFRNGGPYTHRLVADEVVLALPQSALRRLMVGSSFFAGIDGIGSLIESVVSMPLTKLNLFYREPWWRDLGITGGGSFTDLPFGQMYAFEHHTGAGAITLYSDSRRAEQFWPTAERMGILGELAVDQLRQTFGPEVTAPDAIDVNHWGPSQPLNDGDHLWAIGVDDQEVRRRMARLAPGLAVVGEAYSDDQSWVEGALRSVENHIQAGSAR